MKTAVLTAISLFLLAAPASAQNCWWNGMGMHCAPGWGWDHERREERREEWRERRTREEMIRRQEFCAHHPMECRR